MTTRKHGTKPNLNAQKRRSAQAHALESGQYRPRGVPDKRRAMYDKRAEEKLRGAYNAPVTMYGRDKKLDWQGITLTATNGMRLGAILQAAYNVPRADIRPRYGSRATVTSDGFLIADFIARDGGHHMGAFVGSVEDTQRNCGRLAAHCELTDVDAVKLINTVAAWYGK